MLRTWVICETNRGFVACLRRGESLVEVFIARTSCRENCIDFRLTVMTALLKFRRIQTLHLHSTPPSEQADHHLPEHSIAQLSCWKESTIDHEAPLFMVYFPICMVEQYL